MTPYDALARVYELQHAYYLEDLALYLRLARACGPQAAILELGCGSGRLLLPLAEAGHRVIGVDESAEMLRIAERKLYASRHIPAERWALIHADARALSLDEQTRFDLAVIALNTFLHNLSRDEQLAALRTARRHLRLGGLLVVDLPPNDEMAYQPDDGTFQLEATLIDPQTNSEIHKYVASRVFWATQEQELRYRMEERRADGELIGEQMVAFRLRHVFRHEMELLLLMSGFAEPAWYGDYEMNPYEEGSRRMIALAQAA